MWRVQVRFPDSKRGIRRRRTLHRVISAEIEWALCGHKFDQFAEPALAEKPPGEQPCLPCRDRAGPPRKRQKELARRKDSDARDRARTTGTSVRTVSGGLPSLGRDR